MIEAGLEFACEVDHLVTAFATLPSPLRPIYFSQDEKVSSPNDRLEDQKRRNAFLKKNSSGFFLLGKGVTYSIRIAVGRPVVCDCFIDVEPTFAKQFLVHMALAQPLFGFACSPEEREQRNRVTTQQGLSVIESWVGRDIEKYVPGFYWLTLLPDGLVAKHRISLRAVERVAREHTVLPGGQHLFCFYDRPENWRGSREVAELCASLPGVFDVEKIKPQLAAAKNFLELNSILRKWK